MVDRFVYFIQAGENGPIKIGMSLDPVKRMACLQVSRNEKLRLLAVMVGGRSSEKALHQRFKNLRLSGEWFRPKKSLLAFIDIVKSKKATTATPLAIQHGKGEACARHSCVQSQCEDLVDSCQLAPSPRPLGLFVAPSKDGAKTTRSILCEPPAGTSVFPAKNSHGSLRKTKRLREKSSMSRSGDTPSMWSSWLDVKALAADMRIPLSTAHRWVRFWYNLGIYGIERVRSPGRTGFRWIAHPDFAKEWRAGSLPRPCAHRCMA